MNKGRIVGALLLLVFSLWLTDGRAQRFSGGITAGLSATQVDGDTYSGYDKAGAIAGGWAEVLLSGQSSFRLEMNYIQKGSRHNPDSEKGDYKFLLIKLGYVEMPMLYRYTMKNRFFLETGPSLGVLLHSHSEVDYLPSGNPFRIMDVSFQAGVGYHFTDKLQVGLRSGNSIYTIRKERVTGDRRRFWGYGQYNNVLALQLSYTL